MGRSSALALAKASSPQDTSPRDYARAEEGRGIFSKTKRKNPQAKRELLIQSKLFKLNFLTPNSLVLCFNLFQNKSNSFPSDTLLRLFKGGQLWK
jgi:hypothetical protein